METQQIAQDLPNVLAGGCADMKGCAGVLRDFASGGIPGKALLTPRRLQSIFTYFNISDVSGRLEALDRAGLMGYLNANGDVAVHVLEEDGISIC
jgi:hypothetical protein